MKKVVLFELLSAIDLDILIAEEKEAKKCRKQRIRHNILLLLPIVIPILIALMFLLIRFFPHMSALFAFGTSAPPDDSATPVISGELLHPTESTALQESEEAEPLSPPGYIASEGLAFRLNHANKTATVTGIGICTDTEIYIPYETDGCAVTAIDRNAFAHSTQITHVTFPDSIQTVGELAFVGCYHLRTVEMSAAIESIGVNAFQSCSNLIWYTYDNGLYLGNPETPCLVFLAPINAEIEVCTLHPDTRLLAADAFDGCSALQSVLLNDSLLFIDAFAFSDCTVLHALMLPGSLKQIGESAFCQHGALTLTYKGHYSAWTAMDLDPKWLIGDKITLYCTDGIYQISGHADASVDPKKQ